MEERRQNKLTKMVRQTGNVQIGTVMGRRTRKNLTRMGIRLLGRPNGTNLTVFNMRAVVITRGE
jgi:hypothetical protein